MLVNLAEYLEELKEEKLAIETKDNELEIHQAVAEFETKLRAEYAEKRENDLKEKNIEIDVLERIVAREAKKEEEAKAALVDNAPVADEVSATDDLFAEQSPESVDSVSINNDFIGL